MERGDIIGGCDFNRRERPARLMLPPYPTSNPGRFFMYAVFEIGSKQYKVKEGDVIKVEKLDVAEGGKCEFDKVLVVGGGEGLKIGRPYVAGAMVTAVAEAQGKHKKVIIYKFKSKKGFHKKKGHRQPFTSLKIEKISD
jgi:large subunit ribosomal protein L21